MARVITIGSSLPVRMGLFCLIAVGQAAAASLLFYPEYEGDLPLVRVDFITEINSGSEFVEINGKRIIGYSPAIIQVFSSAGIVLGDQTHIMTFLGYHWVEISDRNFRLEVTAGKGQKWKAKLIGIDENNGVSVLRLLGGKLKATPVCTSCEVKDGTTVMAPIFGGPGGAQFHEAQILSIGIGQRLPWQNGWTIKINRPFPDIGLPVLTADRKVLGFVASQDPGGILSVIYPISQMLSSAERILGKGGDIRAGWLGIYLADAQPAERQGIVIQGVEPDSPAQRAGLMAGDLLFKYNGQQIADVRQFIHLVQSTPIGSRVALEILRNGNPMSLSSSVEARRPRPAQRRLLFNIPGIADSNHGSSIAAPRRLNPQPVVGLDTVFLTPPLADALQIPGKAGLLVIDVSKDLPADRAGILAGDVIVAMDGQPILDIPSFASYLQNRDWGKNLELKILRKGVEHTINLELPGRHSSDQAR